METTKPLKAYKVGGAVRDRLLGFPVKDVDWVVVGSTTEQMLALGYQQVGADFPVFLHPNTGDEFALARTERKSGSGYGGFTVHASQSVTLEEDLARRDLTINAMAEEADGTLVDPYGGQKDLQARVLRHVSPAFAEDPLRVLRVARFAARYAPAGFTVAKETMALMAALATSGELSDLTAERIWKEVSRALMEPCPDVFVEVLRECGALKALLPEVDALFGVPQPEAHHPEVDTGKHVMLVLQQAAFHGHELPVRWACLMHDLGKALSHPVTWPKHHGHEAAGLVPVKAVCKRLKVPRDCHEAALLAAELHTHCHRAFELRPVKVLELLRKLDAFRRPSRFEHFLATCEMDARGRLGLEAREYPQADYLRAAANAAAAVDVGELIARGLEGKALGDALHRDRLTAIKRFKATEVPATV